MEISLRRTIAKVAYRAIAKGARVPNAKVISDLAQWGKLIDLTRALDINVFLDVGANRGFFSEHLRNAGYRGKIFSFEPIPEDHANIVRLSASDINWSAQCFALGAENGTRNFHINTTEGQTVLSSFLPMKNTCSELKIVPVQIRRLDSLLPSLVSGIEKPRIFLKMDTQGFDSQVMEGATNCLDQVFGLQSELSVTPLYENMPHYTEALANYEALGFQLMDMFVVNRTENGAVLEYDCLMARR